MALVGVELETLVMYSIFIINDGASRRRPPSVRFRSRREVVIFRFLFIYMKTMTENLKISQIAMKNTQRK